MRCYEIIWDVGTIKHGTWDMCIKEEIFFIFIFKPPFPTHTHTHTHFFFSQKLFLLDKSLFLIHFQ
jgi:hypothetical protein